MNKIHSVRIKLSARQVKNSSVIVKLYYGLQIKLQIQVMENLQINRKRAEKGYRKVSTGTDSVLMIQCYHDVSPTKEFPFPFKL